MLPSLSSNRKFLLHFGHDEGPREGFLARRMQCKRNNCNADGFIHLKVKDSQEIILGQ